MGYEFNLRGWCKLARPIDLDALDDLRDRFDHLGPDGSDGTAPRHLFRITGSRKDVLLFAGDGRSVIHTYRAVLLRVLAAAGGGLGLVTIPGEIGYDGKDRMWNIDGEQLIGLSMSRIERDGSPWNALYHACGALL